MKHAYLIIAHNNFEILELLIKSIDDNRNDIYLHIDAKVKEFDFYYFKNLVIYSNIYFTQSRVDVRWGSVSQIETELLLFKTATNNGTYLYYHLLSGVDMPIKSQDEIHNICNNLQGYEFITYLDRYWDEERVRKLWLFGSQLRKGRGVKYRLKSLTRKLFMRIQKATKYNHFKGRAETLKKGANWVSITDNAARYIVSQSKETLKLYRFSWCGDEVYKQTILYNSPFRDKIYTHNGKSCCKRAIDWERGGPYTYRKEDFELLINSPNLFARKFDWDTDCEIVKLIYNYIKNRPPDFVDTI